MANPRGPPSQRSQQSSSSTVPQTLKLMDYIRPVLQESFMIREYCLFSSIQRSQCGPDCQHYEQPTASSSSSSSAQENDFSQQQQPLKMLTGLYVIPSAQSAYLWFGLLCVNNERSSTPSPWHGGMFRFIIKFPESYPNSVPTIQFVPLLATSSTTGQQSSLHFVPLQTHPDVSPSTGQFNLKQYYSNSSTSSSSSTFQKQPKIYKILRSFRKAFYKSFASPSEVEYSQSSNCLNPAAIELVKQDYPEFLKRCSQEVEEGLKWLKEVDSILSSRFKGDENLILLSLSPPPEPGEDDNIYGASSTGGSNERPGPSSSRPDGEEEPFDRTHGVFDIIALRNKSRGLSFLK